MGTAAPGQPAAHYGDHGWVEYHPGTLPLVLAAPHGGSLKPATIPKRSCEGFARCSVKKDLGTREFTLKVADSMFVLTGHRPHVVLNNLHRQKLDPNRPAEEGAQCPATTVAHHQYHNFLRLARARVAADYQKAFLFDIHRHAHKTGMIELGYCVTGPQLESTDQQLDASPELARGSSIADLWRSTGVAFSQLLRGNRSLGALLAAIHPTVPSPQFPFPLPGGFFAGGFTTRYHSNAQSAATGGVTNAVQIELPGAVGLDKANAVAEALLRYAEMWHPSFDAAAVIESGSRARL